MSKVKVEEAQQRATQLIAQGSFRQAAQITEQLVGALPKDPAVLHMHATVLYRRGLYSKAISTMRACQSRLPAGSDQHTKSVVAIAQSQTMLGDLAGAVKTLINADGKSKLKSNNQVIAAELIERYLDLDESENAMAVLARHGLTTALERDTVSTLACAWARSVQGSVSTEDTIVQLRMVADGPSKSAALSFVLGRLLEKSGHYDEAFARYQQANAFQPPVYESDRAVKRAQHIRKSFTAEMLNSTIRPKHDLDLIRPVLIVGMPRSGTTLTEQILGAHPLIGASGESQALPEIARSLKVHPTSSHAEQLQSMYLNELCVAAGAQGIRSKKYITDKNLMNVFLIGLAHAIVPDAVIIYVHRDPRDVCFSCFNSPLANDHNYKFNLVNCAHFLSSVDQTIKHFRAIIQADSRTTWIDLSYEQLTQEPQSTITDLFEALGLEPHPDCFHFHKSSRSVRTISKDQVREPMHTRSIARWKNFEHIPEVQGMLEVLKSQGMIPA